MSIFVDFVLFVKWVYLIWIDDYVIGFSFVDRLKIWVFFVQTKFWNFRGLLVFISTICLVFRELKCIF